MRLTAPGLVLICAVVSGEIRLEKPSIPPLGLYAQAFIDAVDILGLDRTNPAILACLYAKTGNTTYAEAAVRNLGDAASDTKPAWLANDRVCSLARLSLSHHCCVGKFQRW